MVSAPGCAAGERGRAAGGSALESKCRSRSVPAGRGKAEHRGRSAPPGKRVRDLTPRERRVTEVRLFMWLVIADVQAHIAMTDEEVEEEYLRAGKLHTYDPDTEWQKRLARVARRWPPPDGLIPEIDDYLKLLDDDEEEDGYLKLLYDDDDAAWDQKSTTPDE